MALSLCCGPTRAWRHPGQGALPSKQIENPRHPGKQPPHFGFPSLAQAPSRRKAELLQKPGHRLPAPGSAPCHQLIMPACLFIYWLYKKPNALLAEGRRIEGEPPPDGPSRVTDLPWLVSLVREGHCEQILQFSGWDTSFQGTLWVLTPSVGPNSPGLNSAALGWSTSYFYAGF